MVLSADETVTNITILTEKSEMAQGPAQQIDITNFSMASNGFGPIPTVTTRLIDIVTTAGTFNKNFFGTKGFATAEQQTIFDAFRTFVKVHQDLLNILIGKAGLVPQLLPIVGPPLAAALRQLESVVDTIAYELINTCQDLASDFSSQKGSLDETIKKAIESWGISMPSMPQGMMPKLGGLFG